MVVLWNLEMPIAHRSSFVSSYSIIATKIHANEKKSRFNVDFLPKMNIIDYERKGLNYVDTI